jgi:hypothetical protein
MKQFFNKLDKALNTLRGGNLTVKEYDKLMKKINFKINEAKQTIITPRLK